MSDYRLLGASGYVSVMVYVGLSNQLSIHNSVSSQSMQCNLHAKIILLGLCLDNNVLVMEV